MGQIKVVSELHNGIKVLQPAIFGDARGYFFEVWNRADYAALGIGCDFIQDNESKSSYGVLRGLHYQLPPYAQAKLVRVQYGKVLDVTVDIRRNSPTFGEVFTVEISSENHYQIFIPRGFAHGFSVLSDEAVVCYKCDNIYSPASERGIAFDDPDLGIDWRIAPDKTVLSEKDRRHPGWRDAEVFE